MINWYGGGREKSAEITPGQNMVMTLGKAPFSFSKKERQYVLRDISVSKFLLVCLCSEYL
jgi:hypothetical protein